jgi:hypothetical protein
MWYVHLTNNIVDHVVKVDPYSVFAPEFAEKFIEAPEGTEAGYIYDGEIFTPPVIPEQILIAPTKEELLKELTQLTLKIQALE